MSTPVHKDNIQEHKLTRKNTNQDNEQSLAVLQNLVFGLSSVKTSIRGYDKTGVKKYLEKIVGDTQQKTDELQSTITDLKKQNIQLKNEKDSAIQKYNDLVVSSSTGHATTATISSSTLQIQSLEEENRLLKKEIAVLQGHAQENEDEKKKRQETASVTTTEEQLFAIRENARKMRAENNLLRQNIIFANDEAEQSKNDMTKMQEKYWARQKKAEELEQKYNSLMNYTKRLEQEILRLKAENEVKRYAERR